MARSCAAELEEGHAEACWEPTDVPCGSLGAVLIRGHDLPSWAPHQHGFKICNPISLYPIRLPL